MRLPALYRMLLREFWHLRGQAAAIAVVIGGGVATLVMSLAIIDTLQQTRDDFYRDYRFGHVFASLERAPESLVESLRAIPGVQLVESRVVAAAHLEPAGFPDPVAGRLQSLPDGRNSELNALFLRTGRLPEAGMDREVVASEAFAEAHGLRPGDTLSAIIHGHRQRLTVVGIALSPEHIYQIQPGTMLPDYERYGVLWMNRTALAAARDMEGAFNDVSLRLQRGAREGDVIQAVDAALERYGGRGAIGRADQLSHRYLEEELNGLETLATLFPAIFLGVAAFLLNVVVGRLVSTQREQIGVLKAFGRSNLEVGLHYVRLVLMIVVLGLGIGVGVGLWLGGGMAAMYAEFFRFPYLSFHLGPRAFVIAALVTVASALLAVALAVRRAVVLPPAVAMQPEPPPAFRATVVERLGLQRWFSQPVRMILRSLERRPVRALMGITGVAFACAILMVGRFQDAAIHQMVGIHFGLVERDDITVTFTEPTARKAVHELEALPGVVRVEPWRSASVELRSGHRTWRLALQGQEPGAELRRLLDTDLRLQPMPEQGLLLTDWLARELDVRPGDRLQVTFLEGRRTSHELVVGGVITELIGVNAYLPLATLQRLLGEGSAVSGARLQLLPGDRAPVVEALRERPGIAGIAEREAAIDSFYDTLAETVLMFTFITTLLAGSIAFGVIYNGARISLSERARELASLRVLGFTRGEVARILLGEQAVLILAGLLPGFLLGWLLYGWVARAVESDLYRVPVVLTPSGMAFAALIVVLAGLLSAWVVRRRLDRLDLVEVLKTRE
ncbi:ABC transporter permease [Alkalilimnicola ehrlichii]|uniref:ABC transporter permease n=1 Tax=Alkalilimnicola ehrlichii TaxID=351052 RepID=UPI003BA3AAEF